MAPTNKKFRTWNGPAPAGAASAAGVTFPGVTATAGAGGGGAAASASSSTAAPASSSSSSSGGSSLMERVALRAIRAVRTFEPRAYLHRHVSGIYLSCVGAVVIYANYRQMQRMGKLYPNYTRVAKEQGQMYMGMKEQELAEVTRFNTNVNSMRADVTSRMR